MQYRGTLSDNSKVAVGVLLFAANVIILMGPFLIICLVAFRALPKSIVQRFLGDDASQLATAADPTGTVGEVIMCVLRFVNFFQASDFALLQIKICFLPLCVIVP